jgi:predicted ribosome quality control (RQC) complex YloA/Tae2 family protein
MYFDSLTTAAVADELREKTLGGRVQRIVQVDSLSLGLEIFADGVRHQLLASADPQHPRLHLVNYRLRRGTEGATPLLQLARKYLRGARLTQVEHPPFERMLSVAFSGPEGEVTLLLELIERRANLILLRGNWILDAARRVGPDMNRYRTVLPGQPYTAPPAQPKLDPVDVTELALRQLLATAEPSRMIWRVLVAGVSGISPLFARELVFRATGDVKTPAGACDRISPLLDALLDALIPYWEHDWQPTVILGPDGGVTAFAPYPLTHLGQPEPLESISLALTRYYQPIFGTTPYQAAKAPLLAAIEAALQRINRRRDALLRQAPDPSTLEELRKKGELILAYSSSISPGQTELLAQYDMDGPPLVIRLDPKLPPVANAQALFRDYEKGKRAAADVPKRLAATDLETAYLNQLAADLELAENWPEIDEVRETLSAAGFLTGPPPARPRGRAAGALRVVSEDGMTIWVGRNSRQNEEVTFRRAAPNDLWLHARGVPGGHVVVKNGGRPVGEETLRQAARLTAWYSAARSEAAVPVDVVPRQQVHRVAGGKARPGMVTYVGEKTIRVDPAGPAEAN